MDRILIRGGTPLTGTIPIGGAKNAALPLMAASLLTAEPLVLANLPDLADIRTMANLLGQHGVTITNAEAGEARHGSGQVLELSARNITSTTAPYDLVRKMRASVLVLGPLVARFGRCRVSLPGGCAIGTRPVDLHLKGLERLGAEVELSEGYIEARAPKGLRGAEIVFPSVSVGATENLLMAASLAEGETVLINAAREPEITDLAQCLVAMGADIDGIGSDRLVIRGASSLHGARHTVIPDRIETGTYMMAAAATGGDVRLVGAKLDHVEALVRVFETAGVCVSETADAITVRRRNGRLTGTDVMTVPRFCDRSAGADHGIDGDRRRRLDDHRDDLREPLYARPRARADGRQHQCPRRLCAGPWRAEIDGSAGHGDRFARLGIAGHRGSRRRRRDDRQPRLPSRPRL